MATVPADEARDHLGTLAAHVADTGGTVRLTADGAPAGALAPPERVTELGLTLAGVHAVSDARAHWAAARRAAAERGPQAITRRGELAAVLLGPGHAHALDHGLPPLAASEIHWDGETMSDEHGEPIPPGDYLLPEGGTLHIAADGTDAAHP